MESQIKLSINSSSEVQPKWTMPGRVKYIPNIVMDLDTLSNRGTMQVFMVIHTRFVILGIPVTNLRGISRFKHAM